jgi:RNA polymerase sigma factor (sigma-70 family)
MQPIDKTISWIARQDRGRLLSALIAKFRSFDLAEDALQEAFASAAIHWGRSGLPANPQAWLYTAANRKALDRIRKAKRDTTLAGEILQEAPMPQMAADDPDDFPDHRLRLIFTCCHPALELKSRVALTLRTLGGLTTPEIARAFVDSESTLGQRLSRAKAKIAKANIPYKVPEREAWGERLEAVLTVIYLIFNEGYSASAGEVPLRAALCEEAIFLGEMLATLKPEEPEILGLLALMKFIHARRGARFDGASVVPLDAQDRDNWNTAEIALAHRLLDAALARRAPGPFQIQAAIAALHCAPGPKDWPQIAMLYAALIRRDANPVIRLNFAVALSQAGQPAAALAEVEALSSALGSYQPFHAARANLLAQNDQPEAADRAYETAIAMARTDADAAFLRVAREGLTLVKG